VPSALLGRDLRLRDLFGQHDLLLLSQSTGRLREVSAAREHRTAPDRPIPVAIANPVYSLFEAFPSPLTQEEWADCLFLRDDAGCSHSEERRLVGKSSARCAQVEGGPEDRLLVVRGCLQRALAPVETHVCIP